MYRCPLCAGPLRSEPTRYACTSGHSFDVAREGYVNLLTSRQSRARRFAGADAQVRDRHCFLGRGHYEPLRSLLRQFVPPGRLLDVGCGDGYYTEALEAARRRWTGGIDLSRLAVRFAARRTADVQFAVATAFDMPVETSSVDVLVSVFGPVIPSEFLRVVSPRGSVVAVSPGPRHLIELQRLHSQEAAERPLTGPIGLEGTFSVSQRVRLSYDLNLAADDLTALVGMTPYRWLLDDPRLPPQLDVTVDFIVALYGRPSTA